MTSETAFQARLSAYLTSSFADGNAAPLADDQLVILEHYSDKNVFDDEATPVSPVRTRANKRSIASTSTDTQATADTLARHVSVQRTANDRMRRAVLQPLQAVVETDDGRPPPSLALRTRCHRLKRVLDVHTNAMNIEDEVCRIWKTSSSDAGDSSREFVRRRALGKIEQETTIMTEESDSYELPGAGRPLSGSSSSSRGGASAAAAVPSSSSSSSLAMPRRKQTDIDTAAMNDGRRCEAAIYNYHEAVENILRALLDLSKTIDVGGQLDDVRLMMEFDAIGRRSSSSSDKGGRPPQTLVNMGAIQTLLASLPPKYNAEIVLAPSDDYANTRS